MSGLACRRPALIVESFGDVEAVPRLVREVAALHGIHDMLPASNPMKARNFAVLQRELERWVERAWLKEDADSALVVIDCDDVCPLEVAYDFTVRLDRMTARPDAKPVGVVLAYREFETLFLACLPPITARYPDLGWNAAGVAEWADKDVEVCRGAKEKLTGMMKKGRIYKETEHQVRFVGALDHAVARRRCRWFRHFERTLLWLAGRVATGNDRFHPEVAA